MRPLIQTVLVFAATVWSLLIWGSYLLLGWIGGLAARHADAVTGHPETVVWLSWLADFLTSLGLIGLIIAWLVGLAALLLIAVAARVLGRRTRSARAS